MELFELSPGWCEDRPFFFVKEPINALTGFIFNIIAFNLARTIRANHPFVLTNHFVGVCTVMYHVFLTNIFRYLDQWSIVLLFFVYILYFLDKPIKSRTLALSIVSTTIRGKPLLIVMGISGIVVACLINVVMFRRFNMVLTALNIQSLTGLVFWIIDRICVVHTHWLFHLLMGSVTYKIASLLLYINKSTKIKK